MAETKISKAQAGSGIWTSDSLVAGTNISITQVPQPVIDENTLVVAHLDENLQNSAGGSITITSFGNFSTTYHKFGTGSSAITKTSTGKAITSDFSSIIGQGDYTLDFWHLRLNNGDRNSGYVAIGENSMFYFGSGSSSSYNISVYHSSYGSTSVSTSTYGTWNHYAIVRKNGTVAFYINGVKQTQTYSDTSIPGYVYVNSNNYSSDLIDEVRVSNVARWTSDFTPFTQPYAASAGPTQYAINNTKADPDLSSYLQNTATGTDGLTISGTAETNTRGTNIGVGSSISGNSSTAIGANSYASGANAVVIGSGTSSDRPTSYNSCVAIGSVAKATVTGSIAVGSGSYCNSGTYSVTVGTQSRATGSSSTTLGSCARSTGTGSIAIGSATGSSSDVYTNSSAEYSIAIGYNSKATASSAIQLGSGTNSTASTFQVFNTTVVNASGKIPAANLDTAIPDVSTKADTDLSNVTKPYVTETYSNGASWYRVWSDGWCEQGGQKGSFVTTISFLKSFSDTNYYFNEKCYRTGSTADAYNYYTSKTMNSITILQNDEPGFWYACGYIS